MAKRRKKKATGEELETAELAHATPWAEVTDAVSESPEPDLVPATPKGKVDVNCIPGKERKRMTKET